MYIKIKIVIIKLYILHKILCNLILKELNLYNFIVNNSLPLVFMQEIDTESAFVAVIAKKHKNLAIPEPKKAENLVNPLLPNEIKVS